MKKFIPHLVLVVLAFCLGSVSVRAQSEKIPIRLIPQPNQTTHLKMIQETDLEITFEGDLPAELAAMNPTKMLIKSTVGMTQKNGAANKQGQVEAVITYDQFESEMNINGTSMPVGGAADQLVGKNFTAVYDEKGNLIDVKTPDSSLMPADLFKQMMQQLLKGLPTEPMSIGETATLPLNMSFPLPLPGAKPINFEGQTVSKLVAVDKEASNRLAKFVQTVAAKVASSLDLPGPDGGSVKLGLDFQLNGDGAIQINIDKRLLKLSESKINIEGKLSSPDKSGPFPVISIKGVIKVMVTGSE